MYVFCNAVVDCYDGSDEDFQACERGKNIARFLLFVRLPHIFPLIYHYHLNKNEIGWCILRGGGFLLFYSKVLYIWSGNL